MSPTARGAGPQQKLRDLERELMGSPAAGFGVVSVKGCSYFRQQRKPKLGEKVETRVCTT